TSGARVLSGACATPSPVATTSTKASAAAPPSARVTITVCPPPGETRSSLWSRIGGMIGLSTRVNAVAVKYVTTERKVIEYRAMRIREVQADHYFIPLPTVLSDSTHGTIRGFELLTVRLHDAEGAVGVGYTYTVGTGGAAVHALVARDLAPLLA